MNVTLLKNKNNNKSSVTHKYQYIYIHKKFVRANHLIITTCIFLFEKHALPLITMVFKPELDHREKLKKNATARV